MKTEAESEKVSAYPHSTEGLLGRNHNQFVQIGQAVEHQLSNLTKQGSLYLEKMSKSQDLISTMIENCPWGPLGDLGDCSCPHKSGYESLQGKMMSRGSPADQLHPRGKTLNL